MDEKVLQKILPVCCIEYMWYDKFVLFVQNDRGMDVISAYQKHGGSDRDDII
ncbi:MAG: hypothetical protein HDR20_06625 [Lachnospiraceae bacterium]|nr:hypothetical protein [Lachnospiraceae bacterium]